MGPAALARASGPASDPDAPLGRTGERSRLRASPTTRPDVGETLHL